MWISNLLRYIGLCHLALVVKPKGNLVNNFTRTTRMLLGFPLYPNVILHLCVESIVSLSFIMFVKPRGYLRRLRLVANYKAFGFLKFLTRVPTSNHTTQSFRQPMRTMTSLLIPEPSTAVPNPALWQTLVTQELVTFIVFRLIDGYNP